VVARAILSPCTLRVVGGRWLRRAALFAWELPQNVLGAALLGADALLGNVVEARFVRERVVIETKGRAISLGLFVFWSRRSNRWHDLDERNRDHELGHSVQSRMLGPLYLPIVGVPSTARALYAVAYRELRRRKWERYYDGFPEDWADRLGGVHRDRGVEPPPQGVAAGGAAVTPQRTHAPVTSGSCPDDEIRR